MAPDDIQYLVDNADKVFTESENSMAEALLDYGLVDKLLPRTKATHSS